MTKQDVRRMAAGTKAANIPAVLEAAAVRALIERVTGSKITADRFVIRQMEPPALGVDAYELADEDDAIGVRATSGSAACAAVGWYLRERCHSFIGPLTRRLEPPERLPPVGETRRVASPFLYRYFFNYCTFGYTMLFWNWEDYERLSDWLLLAGVNLVLNPLGHEIVWRDLLAELGYTPRECDNFLCGPAYLPWQWMMNLTGFGGDLPAWWYDERKALGNRLTEKLRTFGVQVMRPGYAGMVPLDFSSHFPEAALLDQGLWCGGFRRPPLLLPGQPLYDRVADGFYRLTREHFGDTAYFSVDPFHEGGECSGVDLADYGSRTLEKMQQHRPGAVWFLQGWQDNPKREMLRTLDKAQVLIANLSADNNFDAGDNFDDTPWLYGTVNNFGGVRNISGNFHNSLRQPWRIREDNTMAGIALMMEGIELDEIFFDLFAQTSFSDGCPEEEGYLRSYCRSRYGAENPDALAALRLLAEEVYLRGGIDAPRESALCARPGLQVINVSTWGGKRFIYPPEKLLEAGRLLFDAWEDCAPSEGYRLDLTDVIRQCLANSSWEAMEAMLEAWRREDEEAFAARAKHFLAHFDRQEALLNTNPRTRLEPWLEKARQYGRTQADKRLFVHNAKRLITVWGDKAAAGELRDYAHREWGGMLQTFYKPRWEAFITLLSLYIHRPAELPTIDWYEAEQVFVLGVDSYPEKTEGSLQREIQLSLKFLCEAV